MKKIDIEGTIALVLLACLIGTGVALVSVTHDSRRLFRELEQLRGEQDRLQDDWSALALEVATLAGHDRIDTMAREQLGFVEPDNGRVYVELVP